MSCPLFHPQGIWSLWVDPGKVVGGPTKGPGLIFHFSLFAAAITQIIMELRPLQEDEDTFQGLYWDPQSPDAPSKSQRWMHLHQKHRVPWRRVSMALVLLSLALAAVIGTTLHRAQQWDGLERPLDMSEDVDDDDLSSWVPAVAAPIPSGQWNQMRLPEWIRPSHYRLDLDVDMDDFHFDGHNQALLNVTRDTMFLVIHANELLIHQATLRPLSSHFERELTVKPIQYQMHQLEDGALIPRGEYALSLEFSGNMTDSLRGFYRSKYKPKGIDMQQKQNGDVWEYLALTQFEPLDARTAFPCFDEPALKATFSITMNVSTEYKAISNMPAIKTEIQGDRQIVQFDETPKMSTYLVAYMVSKLKYVETQSKHGVKIAVWARESVLDQAQYPLKAATAILDFFESYYQVPFPLPKIDLIAVPDFAAGAMENWGLITFRDTALLYDSLYSSAASKQYIVEVIAHELGHQWFGNLVSMQYWNDLWLKEGFARFVQYAGTNAFDPNFQVRKFF